MLLIEGNGEGGVIADAEAHLLLVQVLHGQGVVQGVVLQGEGGHQTELVGELGQGLGAGAELQNDGVGGLLHELVLAGAGEAVLAGGIVLAVDLDDAVHHLAGVGEQDGCMVAPDGLVGLPDVLHAVALADDALDLGTPGGDGHFQVFIFNDVFHWMLASLLIKGM